MTSRNNKYILSGILLLGLVFRILFFIQYSSTPFSRHPLLDSGYYDETGQKIASGKIIQDRAFFMGPLYSYWIGLVYAITGRHLWIPPLAQMAAGLAACFLLYILGARLFSPPAGLAASLMYALYKPVLFYEQTILMETLLGFFCVILIYLILAKSERGVSGWWFTIGILMGLAILFRGNILVTVPFVAVWIVSWDRKDPAKLPRSPSFQKILLLFLGVIIGILPATIHNYIAERDLIPISSNDGINLFIGNNEKATGCYENIPGVNMAQDMRGARFVEIALGRRNLKSSEISGFWRSKALEFIKDYPLTFLKLLFLKLYYFWGRVELDQLYSLKDMSTIMPVLSWPLVTYDLVGPLSLIGIFMILKKPEKKRMLPVFFVSGYMVSLLPFFMTARYRIPIVPLLCLFAAPVPIHMAELLKKRQWTSFIRLLALIGVLYIIMNNSFILKKRQTAETFHNSLGIIHEKEGRVDDAIREYKKSLEYDVIPTISANLAHALTMKGDYNGAIHYYREALKLDPENPDLLCIMGEVCLFAGKTDLSIQYLEKAVSLYPQVNPRAYYYLAFLHLKKGDKQRAKPYIKTYLQLKPDDQKALETIRNLGGME